MALVKGELTVYPKTDVGARNYIPESQTMVLDGWHGLDDMPSIARVGFAVVGTSTVA